MNKIYKILAVVLLIGIVVSLGEHTYNYGMLLGQNAGYDRGIAEVVAALQQAGAVVSWEDLGDGRYQIKVHFTSATGNPLEASVAYELHLIAQHYRNGILLSISSHAMSLTDAGKDWLEGIIGNAVGTDVAKHIACSNSSDAFSAAWTAIPAEITTSGLARAAGTYASTGVGTWNITKTFDITGTESTKLYGLYYNVTGNCLLAAEQQGVGAQKNVLSGDTLKITIQGTVS